MKLVRKLGLTVAAGVLSLGLVGLAAPLAHADTSWPCPGCKSGPPRHR